MATFNLAGSSIVNLTPVRQSNGNSNVRFAQEMFNLKRTTPLSSVDYWRVQGDQITFLSIGAVTHVHFTLRAVHFISFDVTEYQNVQHVIPQQVNGGNVVVKGHADAALQSIAFTLGNSVKHGYKLTGTTMIAFTLTPKGVRAMPRIGFSSTTFTINGTTKPEKSVGAILNVTFTVSGSNVPVSNPENFDLLLFSQSNTLNVVKNVSASDSILVINGGFGLVY